VWALNTAATTWRPAGGSGRRGARAGGLQGRGAGPGQGEIDAWREGKQEVERRRQQSGGQGRGVGSRTPTRGGVNRRFKTKTNNTREI
jgi:hypothetical protein